MKKVLSVAVPAVFFIVSAAAAQGPYLGAGFVYNNPAGTDLDYLESGLGLDFRFGYDFGPVALEGNLMGSRHNDIDPGYDDADFSGFSLDLKIFLSRPYDPNQFYLLAGVGSYAIDEFDPFLGADTELSGNGWNLGAGLEHYFNTNVALNAALVYRFIEYDEFEIDRELFSLRPREDGDTLSVQTGLNYHF